MSDLVKRLRGLHHIRRDSTPLSCAIDLAQQAADEIERLTAALSAEPAQELTDERICDLMGWNVEAMQQNEPEDLPTRVRALVRVAEAEAVAADRASRLPEMGEGDWPELPKPAIAPFEADGRISILQSHYTAAQLRAAQVAAVEKYKALVRRNT